MHKIISFYPLNQLFIAKKSSSSFASYRHHFIRISPPNRHFRHFHPSQKNNQPHTTPTHQLKPLHNPKNTPENKKYCEKLPTKLQTSPKSITFALHLRKTSQNAYSATRVIGPIAQLVRASDS